MTVWTDIEKILEQWDFTGQFRKGDPEFATPPPVDRESRQLKEKNSSTVSDEICEDLQATQGDLDHSRPCSPTRPTRHSPEMTGRESCRFAIGLAD
jgi:hypothetical protein